MSDFTEGDRVQVVKDLDGDGRYVGKCGIVHERAQYSESDVPVGVGVKLDGIQGLMEFDPEELAPEDGAA